MRKPPVDHVGDRDLALAVAQRLQQLVIRVVVELARNFLHQPAERQAHVLELLYALRVKARFARILNVLRAFEHLIEVHRKFALGVEEIDLNDQCTDVRRIVEHVRQWRVGYDSAVPVMLAVDYDRWEPRRERAARHDVIGPEVALAIIEIDRVARMNVD